MMNALLLSAMLAMPMQAQTDTTFMVGNAEKVNVETLGGSITVRVWDEERVRVQAEHSNRTYVEIKTGRRVIEIESEARRGPANVVDFVLTVPRRMALDLEANYGDIVIEGADGAVKAETVQGDVTVIGGRGTIEVEATVGQILVDGADGTIDIESSAADIRVINSRGEIFAETAGGSIVLEDVEPSAVDIGSTGGRVHFEGSMDTDGTYFFGAHGGSITIVVREDARASFNVATVHGSIVSNLSGQAQTMRGGERHQFEVGGGGAIVEAETYGGRIRILRSGSEGTEAPVRRRDPARDLAYLSLAPEVVAEWMGTRALEAEVALAVAMEAARAIAPLVPDPAPTMAPAPLVAPVPAAAPEAPSVPPVAAAPMRSWPPAATIRR